MVLLRRAGHDRGNPRSRCQHIFCGLSPSCLAAGARSLSSKTTRKSWRSTGFFQWHCSPRGFFGSAGLGIPRRHQPPDSALRGRSFSFLHVVTGGNGGPLVARRKYVACYATGSRAVKAERNGDTKTSRKQCYGGTRGPTLRHCRTEVHRGCCEAANEVALEKVSGDKRHRRNFHFH